MDRLRWDNIARAAAVVAVVALVVAWPHLRSPTPDLPPATAAPVAVRDDPLPPPETVARTPPPEPRPAPVQRRRPQRTAKPKPQPRPRSHRVRAARTATPLPITVPAPRVSAPAPRPVTSPMPAAPSASEQAAREFAVP